MQLIYTLITKKVADLIAFDRNSRTHTEAQVAQLAASIKEFGFTSPILIDEANTIIAGEGRWRAAKKLKLDDVPCIVLTGLTAAQKAAYVIADNKLALNSGWDTDILVAELARLAELNFDIDLSGFSEVEVIDLGFTVDTELANFVQAGAPVSGEGTPAGAEDGEPQEKNWTGMPEFHQPDAGPFRTVLVHFNDQASVDAFASLIGQNLTDKTKYVWFPKQEKEATPGQVYA